MNIARLALLLATLSALLPTGCDAPATSSTERTRIITEEIPALNPTRTWCIGRFLLDLPPSAYLYVERKKSLLDALKPPPPVTGEQFGGRYKYWFASIVMPPKQMSLEQFEESMRSRQEELRAAPHEKNQGRLLQTQHIENNYVLATWEKEISEFKKIIEGYCWIDGSVFFLNAQVDDDKQEAGMIRMQERLSKLRARATDEIPTEEGFCFPGGFIADRLEHNEEAVMSFEFPEYPDLDFSVDTYPSNLVDEPLLNRRSHVFASLGAAATRVKTLRSGDRPLAGFEGQELLLTVPHMPSGERQHVFIWEYPGRGTLQGPLVKFMLRTGVDSRSVGLSDEQAVALWDSILDSFRLRPVTAPSPQSAPRPEPLASGDKCTRAGRWRCVEDGGTYRFVVGQIMPATIEKTAAEGWFARLRGKTDIRQVPGHWEWAEDDTPGNET